jgi:hypothetical protein
MRERKKLEKRKKEIKMKNRVLESLVSWTIECIKCRLKTFQGKIDRSTSKGSSICTVLENILFL